MNVLPRNTLKKCERLSSGTALTRLFSSGRYGNAPGIKYCYCTCNGLSYNRIVVSVPKRFFRRAVKRNLLKRRIREAYRCHKSMLPVTECGGTDILFSYNTKEIMDFAEVTESVTGILSAVSRKVTPAPSTELKCHEK